MHIRFSHRGSFDKTEHFLNNSLNKEYLTMFNRYGQKGVIALQENTPVYTGETKSSWSYKIEKTSRGYSLSWHNSVMAGNTPLVILIQYGHGTRGGTFVQGIDIVNPSIKPILEEIAKDIWKEVSTL